MTASESTRQVIRLFASLTFCLAALTGYAHEVRPAYLEVVEQTPGQYHVTWKQPIVQNRRLAIDPVFADPCRVTDRRPPQADGSALIHYWLVSQCNLDELPVHIDGLSVTLTDVLVRYTQGDKTQHHILRPESPTIVLAEQTTGQSGYLWLGVTHLWLGIDHVLFVIGLVLFIRQPWPLLKTITAFTLAHSITLALVVLDWIKLDQSLAEVMIALSIVFLARELVQARNQNTLTRRFPWLMALIFGLLHGLGFAGALRDIGLPEDSLWLSLLLFNVGIELGQIAIVALILLFSWLWSQRYTLTHLNRVLAYGMGCAAAFWTIDRTLLLL